MFETLKKYDSKKFVIIRKEKVINSEVYLPHPNLPISTFNYGIKTTLDGANEYSIAYKINNKYIDLLDFNIYQIFDGFHCKIGDVVVTDSKFLIEDKKRITCSDAIKIFLKLNKDNNFQINNNELDEIIKIASCKIKTLIKQN